MNRPLTSAKLDLLLQRLPDHRPFTSAEAARLGVTNHQCCMLVQRWLLVRPVPGVYHRRGLPDSLDLRLHVLALVVPPDCVVTDRTAGWVWVGDRMLAPNDHLTVPAVSVFAPPGRRLRNGLVASGERRLARGDVREAGGLQITSPLRTACDLGRLLHPDQALGAMDALARDLCTVEEIVVELTRFPGYRGIIQARSLAPLVDGRADSQMESASRRRWLAAGLPRPECQVPMPAPEGGWYYVDIGLPDERFGLEYFGEEFHGPEREGHDEFRLAWARNDQNWHVVVARKHNVIGPHQDLEQTLRHDWRAHRAR